MSIRKDQLFQEALQLDDDARAALTALLIESLEPDAESGVEAAWLDEVELRMASLDAGQTATIPWSEVRERLYKS